ncbi:hypothetical protein Calab_2172 [Caldithrix abyssi DSM 13497]|uniref:Uncharacterized protein n=1 Tax=Caldithrix abyssi DSM 13497 TaxID=880073 RepID=H1XW10_CALAY|nr:hypothetical protein [Caldithrix abyssi]APF17700.1 hypothetical protein Cabys_949 [Caldithrix abyssi DSM 13497]EHO41782.1 hypothetical protein Calab_2172 [Caldithrix abyssi DSM 13497]
MQGRNIFTSSEINYIKDLLRQKSQTSRSAQKSIRSKLRKIGFYISDFDQSQSGFTEADFNLLIKKGYIKIKESNESTDIQRNLSTVSDNSKNFDEIRNLHKPEKVNVLYIGESPPSGGTFFYLANSNLFFCIKSAFEESYSHEFSNLEFLDFFKNCKCYLDDLCLVPINNKTDFEREQLRKEGISQLSIRINDYNPKAIIVVMKSLEMYVKQAIKLAGVKLQYFNTTSFPSFSAKNKKNCFFENVKIINELIKLKIIQNNT